MAAVLTDAIIVCFISVSCFHQVASWQIATAAHQLKFEAHICIQKKFAAVGQKN